MKLLFILLSLSFSVCFAQKKKKKRASRKTVETAYQSFQKDPTNLRVYTLENGLKVYLSQNTDAPKIETLIAVKAGSTYDPADQTGLAHYLEHMLFKGTSKLGSKDWDLEKAKLSTISNLYEKHKATTDSAERQRIYKMIDSVSYEASKYAIANEYDKLTSSIGAEGTNAFTSHEMTVYTNTIPSNEVDKWLAIEKERFSQLVLRLFHTELEAVYEEFNRGQDSDRRKQYYALLEALFPNHPYGTQTTIGTSEDLKNPSMKAIHKYFDTYYVPNNMAVIMVGDFEYDEMFGKVKNTFGTLVKKEVTHPTLPVEPPLNETIEKTVYGPSEASLFIGYRTQGAGSEQALKIIMIDYILANATAGLIDLNLNSQQKVQRASSWTNFNKEYGMHVLTGSPRNNQTLDEVKDLLLGQLELVKKGEFDDWLPQAIINDMRISEIKQFEKANETAFAFLDSFIYDLPWEDRLSQLDRMAQFTKEELVSFANTFYAQNYVYIKKEVGADPNQVKVENPGITPIVVNRDDKSDFSLAFQNIPTDTLAVQSINFNEVIQKAKLDSELQFDFIKNEDNQLANLTFRFPVGTDYDQYLRLSFDYLDYLGTNQMSNEELKKEFFKLGIKYSFKVTADETQIKVSGLQANLEKGMKLLFNMLLDLKEDEASYAKMVDGILKSRKNKLQNKRAIIFEGLMSYSKHGENSRLRDNISKRTLESLHPVMLISKVVSLFMIEPEVFYYGPKPQDTQKLVDANYPYDNFTVVPPVKNKYAFLDTAKKVYFVDYDMVQAELLLLSKKELFNVDLIAKSTLFNTYFGSGLSSIVFQEIRESKSLAYSAMSRYAMASKKENPNYLMAYVGTQANKLPEALEAIQALLSDMPKNEVQFNAAKESVLKSLASNRTTKSSIYWEFQRLKKLGIAKDIKKEVYDTVQNLSLEDIATFFNEEVQKSNFDLLVIGNKEDLDFAVLNNYGEVEELTPAYLFNFEE